jgi:hypothetical protein
MGDARVLEWAIAATRRMGDAATQRMGVWAVGRKTRRAPRLSNQLSVVRTGFEPRMGVAAPGCALTQMQGGPANISMVADPRQRLKTGAEMR